MDVQNDTVLEVIYNSVCPICEAGICAFKKKVDPAHGRYIWLDINTAPKRLSGYGVTVDDVRLKIHAIDRDGNLRVGMEAVAAIWAEIPLYKSLAFLARLPILNRLAAGLYHVTAHVLYRWNRSKGRW